ncbi:hypothetical protein [Virgibacillus oceani]|uniref:Uncharacterized protein n=1 Tax=Virgibacillus oceani TaxID=1479511 RepID=A0A917H1P5_9BACI|nr:hypothetical protein [Virgibacillus oceani]GGG64602.1 hypothetical protein GCM10011398_05270 [Virgibacillus oceani]
MDKQLASEQKRVEELENNLHITNESWKDEVSKRVRLREALEFYADTRSYDPRPHIKFDRGKIARQALEGDE